MIILASDRHAVSPGLPIQQKLKFIPTKKIPPPGERFETTDEIRVSNPEFTKLRT